MSSPHRPEWSPECQTLSDKFDKMKAELLQELKQTPNAQEEIARLREELESQEQMNARLREELADKTVLPGTNPDQPEEERSEDDNDDQPEDERPEDDNNPFVVVAQETHRLTYTQIAFTVLLIALSFPTVRELLPNPFPDVLITLTAFNLSSSIASAIWKLAAFTPRRTLQINLLPLLLLGIVTPIVPLRILTILWTFAMIFLQKFISRSLDKIDRKLEWGTSKLHHALRIAIIVLLVSGIYATGNSHFMKLFGGYNEQFLGFAGACFERVLDVYEYCYWKGHLWVIGLDPPRNPIIKADIKWPPRVVSPELSKIEWPPYDEPL